MKRTDCKSFIKGSLYRVRCRAICLAVVGEEFYQLDDDQAVDHFGPGVELKQAMKIVEPTRFIIP